MQPDASGPNQKASSPTKNESCRLEAQRETYGIHAYAKSKQKKRKKKRGEAWSSTSGPFCPHSNEKEIFDSQLW